MLTKSVLIQAFTFSHSVNDNDCNCCKNKEYEYEYECLKLIFVCLYKAGKRRLTRVSHPKPLAGNGTLQLLGQPLANT